MFRTPSTCLAPLAVLVAFALVAAAGHTEAAVIQSSWIDAQGWWGDPNNWDPTQVPNNDEQNQYEVTIAKLGAVVELDMSPGINSLENHNVVNLYDQTLTSPILDNQGTIGANVVASDDVAEMRLADVRNTGYVYVRPGAELRISAAIPGQPINWEDTDGGQLRIIGSPNSPGTNAYLTVAHDLTLTGLGRWHLEGAAGTAYLRTQNAEITNTAGHTIDGSGIIEAALHNEGLVDANVAAHALRLRERNKTNAGLIRAWNSSMIVVTGITLDNDGGTLWAEDGSTFDITDYALVNGGTLTGYGSFESHSGNLKDIVIDPAVIVSVYDAGNSLRGGNVTLGAEAEVRVLPGATLNGSGAWTSLEPTLPGEGKATVTIRGLHYGPNYNARLVADEDLTLAGFGEVQLVSPFSLAYLETEGDARITIGPDYTIRGYGRISAALDNEGTVAADFPATTLYLVQKDKTNEGIMRATDRATLRIEGIHLINADGTLEADRNSTIDIRRGGWVKGGMLTGRGVFEFHGGKLTDATIEPGTKLEVYDSGERVDGTLEDLIIGAGASIAVKSSPATRMSVAGEWTNDGRITVSCDDGDVYASVEVHGDLSLGGTGELQFDASPGPAYLEYLDTGPGVTITNRAGHTIENAVGWIDGRLLNEGKITHAATSVLEIDGSTISDPYSFDMGETGEYLSMLDGPDNGLIRVLNGDARLNGTLTLQATGKLRAPSGDPPLEWYGDETRTIITATGEVTGTFTHEPPTVPAVPIFGGPDDNWGQGHLGRGVFLVDDGPNGDGVTYHADSVEVDLFQAADGDTNGDRSLNSFDIMAIIGARTFPRLAPADWPSGDFTGDGWCNSFDIMAILATGLWGTPQPYAEPPGPQEGGIVDLLVDPADGSLTIDAGEAKLTGYIITSAAGVFTGEDAENLGWFTEDTRELLGGGLGFTLSGQHLLGNVLGSEWVTATADFWQQDLTLKYTLEGTAGAFQGRLTVVPEPGTMALLITGTLGLFALAALARSRRSSRHGRRLPVR